MEVGLEEVAGWMLEVLGVRVGLNGAAGWMLVLHPGDWTGDMPLSNISLRRATEYLRTAEYSGSDGSGETEADLGLGLGGGGDLVLRAAGRGGSTPSSITGLRGCKIWEVSLVKLLMPGEV